VVLVRRFLSPVTTLHDGSLYRHPKTVARGTIVEHVDVIPEPIQHRMLAYRRLVFISFMTHSVSNASPIVIVDFVVYEKL